jgi:hypothetical protein
MNLLRTMRRELVEGGFPPTSKRAPDDWLRFAAFAAINDLLRILNEYRRRTLRGDKCFIFERKHQQKLGHLTLELSVEPPFVPQAPPSRRASR